jgi:GT2 family glycosyltransferase
MIDWVVLTRGDRAEELATAIASLGSDPEHAAITVISNGAGPLSVVGASVVESPDNLGVPGGRDLGVRSTNAGLIGFLDDDARLQGSQETIVRAFEFDDALAVVALRIVDEHGRTNRRHVPRAGAGSADVGGNVALFLGGACVVRREAYDAVGGYFTELMYGHEELELSWRLVDAGWAIRYVPEVSVFHPRTEVSRHREGWRLTGRNRVWIARRTLPWPIALFHVTTWLLLGVVRAPGSDARRAYLTGWWAGWSSTVDRSPISWKGVFRLARLGRPPLI